MVSVHLYKTLEDRRLAMAEQDNLLQARSVYNSVCKYLDANGWQYDVNEEQLCIECAACGEDLPIPISIRMYPDRQAMVLISNLPFNISEDKRIDTAIALCGINTKIYCGSFDYDIVTGEIYFRMTNSYAQSKLSQELFDYMVLYSCSRVDEYNDKLLMLAKGVISLEQLLDSLDS